MIEWKEFKLGEVVELIGGGTPKTSNSEYWGGDIPWLSIADFNLGNKYVYNTEKTITEAGLNNSSTQLLDINDIIISARGTVGVLAVLKKKMAFNQSCYGIKNIRDVTDEDFLYYLIKDSIANFLQIAHGGVFDTITRETFDQIEIRLPPLTEQRAIANILSSLDYKIDLLYRQNKTLEEMAGILWRKMFVEEPNQEWEKMNIGAFAELQRGISYNGNQLGEIGNGIPMHNLNSIDIDGSYKYEGIKYYTGAVKERQQLKTGDLLIVNTDLTQNNRIIGWPIFVPANFTESTFTHHLFSVTLLNNKISKLYLYFLLRFRDYRETLANSANGTTVSMLSKEAICSLVIGVPPNEKQIKFEKMALTILGKQSLNHNQIKTLVAARDTLLPKLMSGEVRVKL